MLHADNGESMKASTMVATLERLGVLPPSLSRPRVSDDDLFSRAVCRMLTYCPAYPSGPYADRAAANTWMTTFVR